MIPLLILMFTEQGQQPIEMICRALQDWALGNTVEQADVFYALAQGLVSLLDWKPHKRRIRVALDYWASELGIFSWHMVEA